MTLCRNKEHRTLQTLAVYPNMKDSRVPAFGAIPAHWQVPRIKNLCCMRSGEGITAESIQSVGPYPVYGGNGQRGFTSKYTHDGNFVLIGRQGALCGNVHLARGRFWASEHAVVATVRSDRLPEWLGAILSVMDLNQYSIAAAQPGLSVERVLNLRLPVPPTSEQAAIVRFLDHADRRIRRYIRAKRKLIALLEEQRQAIIHEAVAGRIDVRTGRPYPAHKDSGVEWLGQVPAHWQVRAAKWYFREADDRSETGSEELLSVSHITGVTPRSEKKNVTMFKAESNVGYKLCAPGDIVVNTMWAWMAALGIARQTGIVSPSYAVYRPHVSSRLNGEYADLLLRTTAYRNEYGCRSTGIRSSRLRLYPEEFLRIRLLCPPREEQDSIVEFVNRASDVTVRYIDRTYDEVACLEEYRGRLAADVVTGKLDVREAATGLPELDLRAAEEEPHDDFNRRPGSVVSGDAEGSGPAPDVVDVEGSEAAAGELMANGR